MESLTFSFNQAVSTPSAASAAQVRSQQADEETKTGGGQEKSEDSNMTDDLTQGLVNAR